MKKKTENAITILLAILSLICIVAAILLIVIAEATQAAEIAVYSCIIVMFILLFFKGYCTLKKL